MLWASLDLGPIVIDGLSGSLIQHLNDRAFDALHTPPGVILNDWHWDPKGISLSYSHANWVVFEAVFIPFVSFCKTKAAL